MLDEYAQKAAATLPANADALAVDEHAEVVEGEVASRTVLIEFPSKATFRTWSDSPAYQEFVHLRPHAADGHLVVAEGLPS